MAKISLRAYNHEIENLVDQNQFDQAIAHARHILNIFPKHLQTYRLLGKAYLESQRYGDAADIFQRVLSSIPDDFVCHVGMSIVREDEGNLDVAIWHMERAFEVQPANVAIQGELRRLYGKRDGLEPPKVRLTRGALARMYLKGELYAQAITEIRTALAEDAERSDLLVLLAQAYFLSNQRVEAANTCSAIIQKLPNCYEANRILAEILAKSERASEAEDYRKRLQLLEPYYAHIPPGASSPDKAPESAIQLERLVWSPGQSLTGGPAQPEWAASLGVDLEATPEKESLPDWLLDNAEAEAELEEAGEIPGIISEEEEEVVSEELAAEEMPVPAEEALPEWMKAAGWQPAVEGEETAVIPEFELQEEPEEIEAAPAEIPEWLKEIAPPEQAAESELPSIVETPELEELPDMPWMEENLPTEDAIPDWLKPPTETEISESEPEAEAGPSAEADLLSGLTEAGESAMPAEASVWQEQEGMAAIEAIAGEVTEGGVTEAEVEGKTIDDEDAFAWLENLAARQGASEAMLLQPEDRRETPPDWVLEASMETVEPAEVSEPPAAELAELIEPPSPAEAEAAEPAPEVPGWFDELASEQPALQAEISEVGEEAPAETAEMPDWLREMGPSEPGEAAGETLLGGLDETEAAGAEPAQLPDWLRELGPEAEEQPGEPVEAGPTMELAGSTESAEALEGQLPEWLRSAAEEISEEAPLAEMPAVEPAEAEEAEWLPEGLAQATLEEEISLEAEAGPAELPDWLRSLSEEGAEAEISAEVSPIEAESGIEPTVLPDWLSGIQEKAPQVPEEAEAPVVEFGMLFSPQELAKIPSDEAERIHIEEPPVVAGDTQPSRVKHVEEQVEPSAPPLEMPSGLVEEAVEGATFPALEPVEEEIPAADLIPDWLKGLGEELPAEEAVTEEMEAIQAVLEPTAEELPEMAAQEAVTIVPEMELAEELAEPEMITGQVEVEPVEAEAQALPTAAEEPGVPLDDESAFAWLESLAVKQGAEEALLLTPEERSEEPPEWIQKALEGAEPVQVEAEAPIEAAPPEAFPVEAAPVELEAMLPAESVELEMAAEEAQVEMPAEEPFAEELPEAVPPYLEGVKATAIEEEYVEAPVELEAAVEAAPPEALAEALEVTEVTPELPSWLVGVEDTRTGEEETIWAPPAGEEKITEAEVEPGLPISERLDLNRAGLIELERLPGVGFVRAQEILNYRQVNGPFFSVDELAEVPGINAELIAEIRGLVEVEFEEAEVEEVTPVPSEDKEIAIIQARNAMIQGDTQTAIGYYEQLIATRQLLPEVIRDLNEALYRYPADISFWQALGDAQVRTGNLQEALDAYTKAEELLR